MAIRVNEQTIPPAGRITMPRGTFLSNPSTAADGMNQGGAGMLPGLGGPRPGGPTSPAATMSFLDVVRALLSIRVPTGNTVTPNYSLPSPAAYFDAGVNASGRGPRPGGPQSYAPSMGFLNTVRAALAVKLDETAPQFQTQGVPFQYTTVYKSPVFNAPSNTLVGSQILNSPSQISTHQVKQLYPNLSSTQIVEVMTLKGYTRTYLGGVGEVWTLTAQASTMPLNSTPYTAPTSSGNPTSLEPGQSVTTESGVTYHGGQDYTDADGNTVSQYAVTLPGVREDPNQVAKHGSRYKWVSTVQRDRDGNWVRVNRQVLRKVYTRSHLKRLQGRNEANQKTNSAQYNQLVNLRVDFG